MPQIDASIPLQAKAPDMVGRISDLIGMQRANTALKSEQQSQRQRKALADFDFQKIIGDDGTIDLNKVPGSGLREAAGDDFAQVLQNFMGVKQQQIAAKQGLINLANDQRTAFGEMLGALRSDPEVAQDTPQGREKVAQGFAQYAEMFPDAQSVLRSYAAPIANAPPGKLAQVVQNIQLQATSASEQASRQAPQYQSTGAELQNINPYAQSGQAPEKIKQTISPGDQNFQFTDQLGNVFMGVRDQAGNIRGVTPIGGAGGPAHFGPGERQALESQANTNFENTNANRIAASLAPQQLDQIDKALAISADVATGGGTAWASKRANIESALGAFLPGFDPAASDATKLQLLDKYAERIAADSARVLGANASTDAARESITRQNANIGYTPKAIQDVLQYAKAQTMAMSAKGDAQESWLKSEGNGITKQHEFETKWRQAYDPRLFQAEAMPDGERADFIRKMKPEEKRKLRDSLQRMNDLGVSFDAVGR